MTSTARETLKKEIFNYFQEQGVLASHWETALNSVKSAVYDTCSVDSDVRREYRDFFSAVDLADGEPFYYRLTWTFSPPHYVTMASFVQRYEALIGQEAEEQQALASSIENALEEQRRAFFFDEYELGSLPGEVVIYADRVEVSALGYQEGLARTLPKGGRYQGKGTWEYPISMRDRFDKGRGSFWGEFPVLYAVEDDVQSAGQ